MSTDFLSWERGSATDFLSWERGSARVTAFSSTVSRARGRVILRIEMEVGSPWELGELTRTLMNLREAGAAAPLGLKTVEQEAAHA